MKIQQQFLKELSESNLFLVAGSYARGEQNEFSDIDFQIKTPKHCVVFGDRNENIDFLIRLLAKYGIKWNSSRSCYISTIGEENDISIDMEFYDDFYRNRKKLTFVEIMEQKFKTW